MLTPVIHAVIHEPIRKVTYRLQGLSENINVSIGAFSKAFSLDFDAIRGNNTQQFSSAFDSSFAILRTRREFSSAFDNNFSVENV